MTVRTFAAAAGVALAVVMPSTTVPTVMFGVPERPPDVPPTFKEAAVPVRLVPGPLNDELAVIVVPLTVPMFVKLRDASITVVPATWYVAVPEALKADEAVKVVPETVPTVMFGVPERPPDVPPTFSDAAVPVRPVPGPENCVDAATVAAFIVPVYTSRAVAGFVVPIPT
jgi:hypothetical protein